MEVQGGQAEGRGTTAPRGRAPEAQVYGAERVGVEALLTGVQTLTSWGGGQMPRVAQHLSGAGLGGFRDPKHRGAVLGPQA